VQLLKIAVIEKPANHVRRDLACALRIKLRPGRELKPLIGAGQGSHETSMEEATGLDHDHASRAIGQPEESRRFGLPRHTASIGREVSAFNRLKSPGP
jgi:hypothetical protein